MDQKLFLQNDLKKRALPQILIFTDLWTESDFFQNDIKITLIFHYVDIFGYMGKKQLFERYLKIT